MSTSVRDDAVAYLASDLCEEFLAELAIQLTFTARERYVEVGEMQEAGGWLHCHNELLNVVTNHLRDTLLGNAGPSSEAFVETLTSTASAFGCEEPLRRALSQTIMVMENRPRCWGPSIAEPLWVNTPAWRRNGFVWILAIMAILTIWFLVSE